MKVKTFFKKYLNKAAIISLCETNGNINYTGTVGDAPRWTWEGREFIKVDGLWEENDLCVITSGRNGGRG